MPTFSREAVLHLRNDVNGLESAIQADQEKQDALPSADVEDLASLRASIVLTSKLQAREKDTWFRRELRADLEDLRWRYFEKVDHIAMSFGVAQAMKAKDEAERRVTCLLQGNRTPGRAGSDSTEL